MGRQVAKMLSKDYDVGLVGRRLNLLESLKSEIPTKSYIKQINVTQTETAIQKLFELIEEMGGLDLTVLAGLLIVAAILGDATNYSVGRWLGLRLFRPKGPHRC